jgi:methionine synthase I (cobalamin-dependent)
LGPEELDQRKTLHKENFDEMIHDMLDLQKEFGFKIFGGCSGTDDHFIDKLAHMLTSSAG